MATQNQKRLFNRFDQYEIAAMLTESAEGHLSKKCSTVRWRFYAKCVLGVLLAVNGYLSHWGPWTWPSNFNIFIFSIIFYNIASYIYSWLTVIDGAQGNMIGEFLLNGLNVVALLRIGEDKNEYVFQLQNKGKVLNKKHFIYYEYFTVDGYFLEETFQKHLAGFLNEASKTTA